MKKEGDFRQFFWKNMSWKNSGTPTGMVKTPDAPIQGVKKSLPLKYQAPQGRKLCYFPNGSYYTTTGPSFILEVHDRFVTGYDKTRSALFVNS